MSLPVIPAMSAEAMGFEAATAMTGGAASERDSGRLRVRRSARPRQYDDEVVFRYEDEGFSAVYLVGAFNDWRQELIDSLPASKKQPDVVAALPRTAETEFQAKD